MASTPWDVWLQRWQRAGLLDAEVAARIREFEQSSPETTRLRWPVLVALVFGGILLSAGVLLFVAAHWDNISPAARMAIVLAMVALFHGTGIYAADRFRALSITMHALGTVALGAGIGLAGQIFNVQEHWPTGILLWAIGSWAGVWLLKQWPQVAMAAVLTPAWFASEWGERYSRHGKMVHAWLLLVAITYLTARRGEDGSTWRKCLTWIGGLSLIPQAIAVGLPEWRDLEAIPALLSSLPVLALAWFLRREAAWMNLAAAVWVLIYAVLSAEREWIPVYAWAGLGSVGLVAWGIFESRAERVNVGMAGFVITVMFFYFSTLMDKLDRSLSLIVLGVLFLGGGWQLERLRRRLVDRIQKGGAQ